MQWVVVCRASMKKAFHRKVEDKEKPDAKEHCDGNKNAASGMVVDLGHKVACGNVECYAGSDGQGITHKGSDAFADDVKDQSTEKRRKPERDRRRQYACASFSGSEYHRPDGEAFRKLVKSDR